MHQQFLEHIVRTGLISSVVARAVVGIYRKNGGGFMDLILERGGVDDSSLARAVGEFYKRKVINISRIQLDPEALALTSSGFCRRNQILPFELRERGALMRVAIWDPIRAKPALELLRDACKKLEVYIAPCSALNGAIEQAFPQDKTRGVAKSLPLLEAVSPERGTNTGLRGGADLDTSSWSSFEHDEDRDGSARHSSSRFNSNFDSNVRFSGASHRFNSFDRRGSVSQVTQSDPSADVRVLRREVSALRKDNEHLKERLERVEAAVRRLLGR